MDCHPWLCLKGGEKGNGWEYWKKGENTYRLVVSTGKTLDGSKARRTKTIYRTRKDAKIALAEFVTEANRGLAPEGKPVTFEEFYHIWQVNYGTKDLVTSTYNIYVGMLESRILPYLGSFTFKKINLQTLWNFMIW